MGGAAMTNIASAHDVASAVIDRLGPVDTMRLQKLVYYVQAWHLARTGVPAFGEPIEAWRDGPVVRELFRVHRRKFIVTDWPEGDGSRLPAELFSTLQWVMNRYGAMSGEQLSRISHAESPWLTARGDAQPGEASSEVIDTNTIRNYYSRQMDSAEEAVDHATSSAALEGITLEEEWREKLRAVALGEIAPEVVLAEELRRYGVS
jgi:uncharacterized phage-associated protein